MRFALAFIGMLLLLGLVLVSARLLLPACGVLPGGAGSWLFDCPATADVSARDRIDTINRENDDLEQSILVLERQVALRQCIAEDVAPEVRPIDREAWVGRDIGLLEGCWALDSRFTTRNQQTGVQSRYSVWEMCFDGSGVGVEEMQADNGNTCRGPISGQFADDGRLVLEQPGNLQCSDGGFIYRMISRCTLNSDGTASCAVMQPEPGSSSNVAFRRAGGGN